ncbi:hypothetical protein BO83DRAFT_411068 [Aspergillus eucalypticola CBS 122712]|uniref:F-box domain-containing protein n=1 Tax=Aspergillus eucalypticola (strain CBS 122712 / IBT 29274) TaxID=1448314 RepID=A0A317UWE7_ASPEC|nr:uncharacterized protein BO83DRAFT_411068 [Aspergillus eucalypticola CBS 122712]PWY64812.1 hypothetical protein BO83DRAFT_411068 [Aspergillus eucalypticola CBS 122712]
MPTLSGEDPLSFSDAFNLAATCRQLRLILDNHTPTIYKRLRRHIKGGIYARLLLVDQGSLPSISSTLGIHHFRHLRRNYRKVEKAINEFDHVILTDIQMATPHIGDQYYHRNPDLLHLTPTERHRFMRSYYQSMLLKHLHLANVILGFMLRLTEVLEPAVPVGSEWLDLLLELGNYLYALQMRGKLKYMWDHCQLFFKTALCTYPWRKPAQGPVKEEQVWNNETDENETVFI